MFKPDKNIVIWKLGLGDIYPEYRTILYNDRIVEESRAEREEGGETLEYSLRRVSKKAWEDVPKELGLPCEKKLTYGGLVTGLKDPWLGKPFEYGVCVGRDGSGKINWYRYEKYPSADKPTVRPMEDFREYDFVTIMNAKTMGTVNTSAPHNVEYINRTDLDALI